MRTDSEIASPIFPKNFDKPSFEAWLKLPMALGGQHNAKWRGGANYFRLIRNLLENVADKYAESK